MSGLPDLDDAFFLAFVNACSRLHIDPLCLIRVLFSESGVRASAHNPNGNAAGIFQAMPDTLKGLGFIGGWPEFLRLSATEQVPYLERYYRPHAPRCTSDALCYVALFLPALLPAAFLGDESFVLCGQRGPLAWAYGANRGLDDDGDGKITVGDLAAHLQNVCIGARYAVIVERIRQAMGLPSGPIPDPDPTLPEMPAPSGGDPPDAA